MYEMQMTCLVWYSLVTLFFVFKWFFLKIKFLVFFDYFDVLISKINFKNKKNIILIYL